MRGLEFSEQFYERETRDGFVVGEVMKRCWAAGLQALEDVKEFCKSQDIRFFAVYGTLLGTVRHGGFIPWDDDIDIGMVRDDYIRFTELFPKLAEHTGEDYQIFNPYTRDWYCMNFSHMVNGRDLSFEREHLQKWHGCPFLVGPDIYPYYYIPRNKEEEEYIMGLLARIDSAIALSRQSAKQSQEEGKFVTDSRLNEMLAYALVELQHETGYEFSTDRPIGNQLEILYDQVCRLTPSEDADYLTRYDEYAKDRSKKFPKEWLENVVELPFENIRMPVPVVYDEVLKKRFGDRFMMPAREPSLHGYPFYAKQMREVGNKIEERERTIQTTDQINIALQADGRCVVLFYTAVREMIISSAAAVAKIEKILRFFQTQQERYLLWWVPGRFIEEKDMAMDLTAPQMKRAYEKLIDDYRTEGYGICDLSGDMEQAVRCCDLFYGDQGMLSEKAAEAGKRVYLQDYGCDDTDLVLKFIDEKQAEEQS
ncbi:MAG: LicD family protein [Lachnospiraceae bacterium]|nr:LicD family protein [Lachnospiraceae bacterium]